MQGRVFGIRVTIAWLFNPIGFYVAGVLADRIFEPLLATHGLLAGTWIGAIGTGPGRGAALLLFLNGLFALAGVFAFCFNRSLLHVENDVNDMWMSQRSIAVT
jgi:hypothetical protein